MTKFLTKHPLKTKLISVAIFASFVAVSLPAYSMNPNDPCESCESIYRMAGVANYNKNINRTNFGVIKKEKKLGKFEGLVKKAGLRDKIDHGEYTVFAPTNDAIDRMDQGMLESLKRPENRDQLVKFVMAHMAPCNQSAGILCEQKVVVNLNDCALPVIKQCNWLEVGGAVVIAPDIQTRNGKVHIIDKVLQPYA